MRILTIKIGNNFVPLTSTQTGTHSSRKVMFCEGFGGIMKHTTSPVGVTNIYMLGYCIQSIFQRPISIYVCEG